MEKLYKTVDEKEISKRRDELKAKKESGKELGRLFGLEIALEDNISTKGIKTEVGSKMLKGYIPAFDAELVTRLLAEDAIIGGKIDTREFGVGQKIDSKMGQVVKEGQADGSIGIDASGEIRSIAAASNLYALKPTYGSVSRYGLIGSAPSLEQAGIIAGSVDRVKDIFKSIAGKDEKDSGSLEMEEEVKDIGGLKIGLIKEDIGSQDESVKDQLEKDLETIKSLGLEIDYLSIPSVKYARSIYNILQSAEFSSDMGKFDGVLYGYNVEEYGDNEDFFRRNRTIGFSERVKKRIMFGNFVLGEANYQDYYDKSQRIRSLMAAEVGEAFKEYDLILSPIRGEDMETTLIANLVGCPALTIPSREKQGFGLQIMGDKFSEETLFKLAKAYEDKEAK